MTGTKRRLAALDVFRGLTMAAMVVVNTPGSWSHIYPPLRHAEWHGCTPTDLVFPFFLFIVGVATAFAEPAQRDAAFWSRVVRRTLILIALGLFLNGFPSYEWSKLRYPGVLQRIAIAYLCVTWIGSLRLRLQWGLSAILLASYGILLEAQGDLSPGSDLGAALDRALFGEAHLYKGSYDPEGLLSSVPSIAGCLIGRWMGLALRANSTGTGRFVLLGAICAASGWAVGLLQPLNKQLWTPSFTLWTSGLGVLSLACVHWLVDVRGRRAPGRPFEIFGRNALFVFVGSGLLARTLARITVTDASGKVRSVWTYAYENFFAASFGERGGSLAQALCALAFWWLVLWSMHRRRLYVRV